ncbi:hypothetical protein [Picosynechococcus sp. PCC 7117]|nr:hypothetical protein [Picosynechococcus sp. PCC 7117]
MDESDYLVLIREEGDKKYVSTESYLSNYPDFKGVRLESFLAHNSYWKDL